jgi:hypothetical protein
MTCPHRRRRTRKQNSDSNLRSRQCGLLQSSEAINKRLQDPHFVERYCDWQTDNYIGGK